MPVTNAERDLLTSLCLAQNTQILGATMCHLVRLFVHLKNSYLYFQIFALIFISFHFNLISKIQKFRN